MDPITDFLTAVRVESICHGRLDATAPWGLRFQSAAYAKFSLVLEGNCWLETEGYEPIWLESGDFLLLGPHRSFTLRHDLNTFVVDFDDVLRERIEAGLLQIGGGGQPTVMVCGKFDFVQSSAIPLMDALPAVIHLQADQTRTPALRATVDLLMAEAAAGEFSSPLVMNRLADVLFIQAMRAYVESSSMHKPAWIGALADPNIGASLRAVHGDLTRSWTVADLASSAGMSRSAYAQKFKQLVGEAPLEYLTRWRMYRACRLLEETDGKMIDVAIAVGYDSDGTFHRAFKRVMGVSPGEYRRRPRVQSSKEPDVSQGNFARAGDEPVRVFRQYAGALN